MPKKPAPKKTLPPYAQIEGEALRKIHEALKTVAPARRAPVARAAAILLGVQI